MYEIGSWMVFWWHYSISRFVFVSVSVDVDVVVTVIVAKAFCVYEFSRFANCVVVWFVRVLVSLGLMMMMMMMTTVVMSHCCDISRMRGASTFATRPSIHSECVFYVQDVWIWYIDVCSTYIYINLVGTCSGWSFIFHP